jgi:hypothetical protein
METKNIIDYAMDGNGADFRSALYSSIHDKVSAHIEAKKQEIAQNLINPASVETDAEAQQQEETPVENT